MITPNRLYQMKPQFVERTLAPLNGCYYQHIPEVELDDIPDDWDEKKTPNTRIERRILRHIDYDIRRYWELTTVWFDDRPVMIVQNAGREGDDHHKRFITDPVAYADMVAYLFTIIKVAEPNDVVDADEPRDDLLRFYGNGLDAAGDTDG